MNSMIGSRFGMMSAVPTPAILLKHVSSIARAFPRRVRPHYGGSIGMRIQGIFNGMAHPCLSARACLMAALMVVSLVVLVRPVSIGVIPALAPILYATLSTILSDPEGLKAQQNADAQGEMALKSQESRLTARDGG